MQVIYSQPKSKEIKAMQFIKANVINLFTIMQAKRTTAAYATHGQLTNSTLPDEASHTHTPKTQMNKETKWDFP